jgi:CubicO group peptidase (beta-lactamase class C family)
VPGLLDERSLRAMFQPHATTTDPLSDGSETQYGYGWSIATADGSRLDYHTGGNAGFRTINVRLPDDDAIAILLSNDASASLSDISLRLIREVTGMDSG